VNVLGQALIQPDLRADLWPDFSILAATLRRTDVCFTDLETAVRGQVADAPTRDGVFRRAVEAGSIPCGLGSRFRGNDEVHLLRMSSEGGVSGAYRRS
jgi:hypothetical protein